MKVDVCRKRQLLDFNVGNKHSKRIDFSKIKLNSRNKYSESIEQGKRVPQVIDQLYFEQNGLVAIPSEVSLDGLF